MSVKGAWQRLLDRAGIEKLWIHDLRRTVGTYMANLGANQAQIQAQLGHRDPQSSKPYVHTNVEFVRKPISIVTQFLAETTGEVE